MAHRCKADRLLALVLDDARFRLAGGEAAIVWLRLVRLMAQLGSPGRLVMGSGSGFALGSEAEIPLALGIPEAYWKAHYGILVARGLLITEGNAVIAPLAVDAPSTRRTEANRLNGLKGGRPRKTTAQLVQREILLPVTGGVENVTQKTPTETQTETQNAHTYARADRSGQIDIPDQRSDSHVNTENTAFAQEMAAVAKLAPVRGGWDLRPVLDWLSAGIDRETIREEITWRAGLSGYQPPRSFMAFNARIRERHAQQPAFAAPRTPESAERVAERTAWLTAVNTWKRNGCYGEPPVTPAWIGESVA